MFASITGVPMDYPSSFYRITAEYSEDVISRTHVLPSTCTAVLTKQFTRRKESSFGPGIEFQTGVGLLAAYPIYTYYRVLNLFKPISACPGTIA